MEILGLCDEIVALNEATRAVVDHLRAEAGGTPLVRRLSWPERAWRWLLG